MDGGRNLTRNLTLAFFRAVKDSLTAARPLTFQQTEFIRLPFPKTLIKKNKTHKVTSLERTIVDALDRPEYAGGWEEIWRSAEHIPILNFNKMVEYAILLGNATTIAKLGFFLEQNKEHFHSDARTLKILEKWLWFENYHQRSIDKIAVTY